MSLDTLIDYTSAQSSRTVVAVYLRGSRMRGLHTDSSDYDYTILVNPTPRDILTATVFSQKFVLNAETEGNITTTANFYHFLLRGLAQALETIHSRPVWVHPSFSKVANFLYENRAEILLSRQKSFISNSLRVSINNLETVLKLGNEDTGLAKKGVIAEISLLHCDHVANGKSLDFAVPFANQDILEKKTDPKTLLQKLKQQHIAYSGKYHDQDHQVFHQIEKLVLEVVVEAI